VVVERKVVTVSRSTVRTPLPAANATGILGVAASLAGIYYVYGGTTPAGFDCSGYTQYVFAKVGMTLPRTAEEQRQATTPVTNPQPGDLVFFGSPAHHVGIYAGNGKMWDSEQTGVPVMMHTDRSERGGGATYGRL
jgi:peptidoglycan DL-endopeptidase CwlO